MEEKSLEDLSEIMSKEELLKMNAKKIISPHGSGSVIDGFYIEYEGKRVCYIGHGDNIYKRTKTVPAMPSNSIDSIRQP